MELLGAQRCNKTFRHLCWVFVSKAGYGYGLNRSSTLIPWISASPEGRKQPQIKLFWSRKIPVSGNCFECGGIGGVHIPGHVRELVEGGWPRGPKHLEKEYLTQSIAIRSYIEAQRPH